MTIPPFAIVSVPVPKLPILSPPPGLLFQVEPGPVTVTVPVEPTANPTEPPPPLFTVPPFWMVSVPVPWPPTTTVPMFVHVEPAPDTVTVPCEPGKLPTNPPTSVNVPPFWIVSIPVPFWPTDRFRAVAPGIATTVEFGVTVSMFALVATVGTPAFQLPAVNQSEETAPVQSVWACVETVDATKSAIAASNLDETNLQLGPCPWRLAPACSYGRQSTRVAPHIGSNQSAMPIIKNRVATARTSPGTWQCKMELTRSVRMNDHNRH